MVFGDRCRRSLSIAEGQAVLAGVGTADQYAALVVNPDRLAAAERYVKHLNLVAAMREIGNGRLGNGAFDLQNAVPGEDARLLGSLLRIHTAIQHAVKEMRMTDSLIGPAHHPKWHHRAAVLDKHPRNDRMERPLARCDGVGMAWDRPEPGPSIVQ